MKTFNHTFTTYHNLENFLLTNSIARAQTLLIQCFDGELSKRRTKRLIANLSSVLPQAILIGTSTDGEIIEGESYSNSIVLSFSIFERSELYTEVLSLDVGSYYAGKILGQEALEFKAKAMILFSDALSVNGDDLMRGINSTNQSQTLVTGGMAGDNGKFEETYVILGNEIYYKSVVCVFIKGETLSAYSTNSFNWEPIGPKFTVTNSLKHQVFTLNDIPIFDVYKEYLGENIANTLHKVGVAFPLIMHKDSQMIGRAPISVLENGSMGFGGNIPQGSVVQFGVGNIHLILESNKKLLRKVLQEKAESIFVYSSTARKRYMGKNVTRETKPLNVIAPTSGFFTYGEFFTNQSMQNCTFLNETMTLLVLSENVGEERKHFVLHSQEEQDSYTDMTLSALSHFVNKTSLELQNLNNSLQKRVQEEITLNRQKDQLMLAQSRRATMGEMIRMIAHQWRQPLSSIGLVIDNLSLDIALDEVTTQKLQESTTLIGSQVQYLSKTINEFTNYFHPENTVESFHIEQLYSELMFMVEKDCNQSNIEIYFTFLSSNEINTYKREVVQICLNLFNNAKDILVEKKKENAYIKLVYRFLDDYHEIHVSDNGGGVPPEVMEKLFEPYFSTKTQKNGTGLGLYMSKTLAQNYLEGDLSCKNDKHGAVFTLRFKDKQKDVQ